ncbi:hypothetical protein F5Y04DRAFT_15678 [Hypomontagnella monticulosa]|nr:hypothetical protein F5Y04DRAFT_15678 [Hypomontagnella monticulosa]
MWLEDKIYWVQSVMQNWIKERQSQHVYPREDTRPEFIPFKVPRLGSAYDFSGFSDYPARNGWIVHRDDRRCHRDYCPPGRYIANGEEADSYGLESPALSKATGSEATCAEKVAFLQSWLFFGALAEAHAVCGLPIDPQDYTTNTFDTTRLNGLPLRLYHASRSLVCGRRKALKKKLYSIIRLGQLMMTRGSDWEDEYNYTLEQCEVLYSIQILLRILSLALLCQFREPFHDNFDISLADPAKDWKPEGQISMINFAAKRLFESGCCQSEARHFLQSFDVVAAAFYITRPYAPKCHDKCTDSTCMAYQVNEDSYRTLHVEDDCDCELIHVQPDLLTDALSKNTVPVINISNDLQLSVGHGGEVKYIAFSHVWADGLGNPFFNALPSCQIRRLYNLALTLRRTFNLDENNPKIAIWIDTLCVPVSPALKQYRKQAIRLLAWTYTEAMAVLVLDRELCHFESKEAPALELGIRVLCSGWLKRLWTLQEASLASDIQGVSALYFQMADGPAYWNRLSRCFQYKPSCLKKSPIRKLPATSLAIKDTKADLLYETHLMTFLEDRIPSVSAIRDPRFDTKFQKVMHAVQNRSTSKAEDEPICLASLLGLDLQSISDAKDTENRMIEFYKLLRELPTAILFSEFGVPDFLAKNLTTPPYRWAPKSLLSLEQPMEITNAVSGMRFADPPLPLYGSCEDDGLHIRHPGFLFDDSEHTTIVRESTFLDTTNGKWYSLSLALSDRSPQLIGPLRRCALIFKTDICSDAVIVSIESENIVENELCFYVRIVGHAQVKSLPDGLSDDSRDETAGCRNGAETRKEQSWCIT